MKVSNFIVLVMLVPSMISSMEVSDDVYEEVRVGKSYLFKEKPLPAPAIPPSRISQLLEKEKKPMVREKNKERLDYWHLKMGATLSLENDGGDINVITDNCFIDSDFMGFAVKVKSKSYKELDSIDVLREEDESGNIVVKTIHPRPLSSQASVIYNVRIPTYALMVHIKTTSGNIALSCVKEKLAELTAKTESGSLGKPSFVSQDNKQACQKYALSTTTGNIVVTWKED